MKKTINETTVFIWVWIEEGNKAEYYINKFPYENNFERYPDGYVDYYITVDNNTGVILDDTYGGDRVGKLFEDEYGKREKWLEN